MAVINLISKANYRIKAFQSLESMMTEQRCGTATVENLRIDPQVGRERYTENS